MRRELAKSLSAEFVARMDAVVAFELLGPDALRVLLKRYLEEAIDALDQHAGVSLSVTDEANKVLDARAVAQADGGRGVRRLVEQEVVQRVRQVLAQSGARESEWTLGIRAGGALRWAAIEAAQSAWRPTNPWYRLYCDVKQRTGKSNPAKSAVARKVLIAAWHVLGREEPFKPSRPGLGNDPVPASSHFHLAA